MDKRAKELLITEVLSPLLEIVYLYKRSECYNFVPDTHEDADAGWTYFENKFNEIYKGLNTNIWLKPNEYKKAKNIITEVKGFVRLFSAADGLPERYFRINPDLRFYRVAFGIQEESDKLFYQTAANNRLAYVPTIEDFADKKQYFKNCEKCSEDYNFRQDEDDFFMDELAYTVRKVFIHDFKELTP